MVRVALLGGEAERGDALDRAVKLLGSKVIGYERAGACLVVRKVEGDGILATLAQHGIAAELRRIPPSN
jgi:hypothetical protein